MSHEARLPAVRSMEPAEVRPGQISSSTQNDAAPANLRFGAILPKTNVPGPGEEARSENNAVRGNRESRKTTPPEDALHSVANGCRRRPLQRKHGPPRCHQRWFHRRRRSEHHAVSTHRLHQHGPAPGHRRRIEPPEAAPCNQASRPSTANVQRNNGEHDDAHSGSLTSAQAVVTYGA